MHTLYPLLKRRCHIIMKKEQGTSDRRMARLIEITAYHLLLLAVYFNANNATPTVQHGDELIGDSKVIHTSTMEQGERGTSMSSTTIQPQERTISHPNTRASHPAALHLWKRIPLNLSMLQTGFNQENPIYGHVFQHNLTVSKIKVKDCPPYCTCGFMHDPIYKIMKLLVTNCTSDPSHDLPKFFSSHRNVKYLELNSCHLSSLPQSIVKLKHLAFLYLIKNNFTSLPILQEMPHIWGLWIRGNQPELVLTDITQLTNLTLLYLNENNITVLPPEIGNMRSLAILDVSFNSLKSLPREIGNLTQLVGLVVTRNELLSLPQEIGTLSALEELRIEFNKLETLPSAIGKLSKLKSLDLDANVIRVLPTEVMKLNQLHLLTLGNNRLREVPDWPHGQISVLGLSYNMIDTIPYEIITSHPLTVLELQHNDLTSFHCRNCTYVMLTTLSLAHNAIEDMQCSYWVTLKDLNLSYNNISEIPEGCAPFSMCDDMTSLDMGFNKMSAIQFYQLCPPYQSRHSYRYLSFRNNTISTIDITDTNLSRCFQTGSLIDLANNRIYSLDSWPIKIAETVDITVNLDGNNLAKFTHSGGPFSPKFKAGTRILLQQNQIKNFKDIFDGWEIIVNTTDNMHKLLQNVYFDLGGNPLVCDCVDYEVYKYIQTLKNEQYKNLVCYKPLRLRGRSPHVIPLGTFMCDVTEKCPDGCTCSKVPYSQSIDVTCESYIQTDIPDILPHLPNQKYGYKLDICNQNLHEITLRPYLQTTVQILLSNNSITNINISSSIAFQSVKILHLDYNLLQRLPESVGGMTNSTATEVKLGNNPWVCDCETLSLTEWIMMNMHIVKDQNDITCHSPPSMVGIKVKDINSSIVCPSVNMIPVYVGTAIGIVVVIIVVNVVIIRKRKFANWQPVGSDECEGEHKEFDVFMCAADGDSVFVENILIPELERRDYRVCYHREHFCGGKPIHVNMSEAIEKSKRTLVYFSNHFRDSEFSMFEFHSAYDLDIRYKTRRLVTIKDPKLDMNSLERSVVHYFETHTYIQLECERFWYNLEYSLAQQRLGAQVRRPNR